MTKPATNTTKPWWSERRAWSDEEAGAYLRSVLRPPRPLRLVRMDVICPDGSCVRGRECCGSTLATDASPQNEPQLATLESPSWASASDARAMAEAATVASLYEGVSFGEGRRREEAYNLQRKIGGRNA